MSVFCNKKKEGLMPSKTVFPCEVVTANPIIRLARYSSGDISL